ncbi:cytosolic coat protein, putative [Trypanosoma equiperdum]|uniref:Cytosolic coat protein, putative n=4 Tax=Trypanozoon TaxID=39700 RepID=Q38CZ1_TRYB2|nr:COP-coated vesicle membrane protein gp25L precursor, putative [Trypanosoma brucei gambiense DAL972]XP_827659.1 cytosolic coat protein, putative [Trypanosoma brucei brucei TREU927]RHW66958.1 cytosolic coat protein [Trypanosoma brucei equiperdum]SCU65635.1 cytosolic coat protein, putative [Trypanosoma equiperdum]EAN77329.1 cytosolic coat protein, putative [Trypanosoma brucei brucei TREU927]CBH14859.1 COP-coated vesicle membrane protein gp25L precursor, putative [Trypanosoma brucei gambiense D|eukprot:XP_011777125.1 COP-coated vesicle membrane protein gp25L precursor, putative [Trypanosoma brucei gambiense DAL972]
MERIASGHRMSMLLLGVGLLCLYGSLLVNGFAFDLPANQKRCFSEEVPSGTELRISYAALPGYAQFVDAYVVGPAGKMYMTTVGQDRGSMVEYITKGGEFTLCLLSRVATGVKQSEGMARSVSVDFRLGSGKNDYANLTGKEKLRPIEVELRVLEDAVRSLHTECLYYREKEAEMRNANESVIAKVAFCAAAIITFFIIFSLWEMWHLKRYFRKKRLID